GRPPAAGHRRCHGPRPAGRRPHGTVARRARRLRLRRRPTRPRARPRQRPRTRPARPPDGHRLGRDLRPRHPPPDLRPRRPPSAAPPKPLAGAPGPPLGTGVTEYERYTVDVPEAATLVLYTDGLIEARDRSIDVGLEQLRHALTGIHLAPDVVCTHILRELGRE